jgi:hypothetical protein
MASGRGRPTIPPPPLGQTDRFTGGTGEPTGAEPPWPRPEGPGVRSSTGRLAAVALFLVSLALISGTASYMLAGGRLGVNSPTPVGEPAGEPAAAAATTPNDRLPTAAPFATTIPLVPTPELAPTDAPTVASGLPQTAVPPAAPAAPATALPTVPAPTAAPEPTVQPPTPQPSPAGPAADPRLAQIEARIDDYFSALRDQDFAGAQDACCTPAWRARYPLAQWERNFDGVTDLRRTSPSRYLRTDADVVVVDTDYAFVSGGAQRTFTLRWTFTQVDGEWRADLAEAFAQ